MDQQTDNLQKGERGAIVSIIAYIFLSVLKIIMAILAGSAALKADGFNSMTDIIASIAVLIGLRISQKPPDSDHPYGHRRAEFVASLVASFIMIAIGLQVLFSAVVSVFSGETTAPDWTAAWTALFCAVVMYVVYRYNHRLAKNIQSQSMKAAAKDNLSDAWVSLGTAVGIIGSQFGLPWLDPITALLVGLLICKTAWDIFKEASHNLTDGFEEEALARYKQEILKINGVQEVKSIKGRHYGSSVVVDVVVTVASTLDTRESHDISEQIERVLRETFRVSDTHVHIEPVE